MAPTKKSKAALPSSEPQVDIAASELSLKQERFCRAYVNNLGNATQAAIEAGYSEDSAREIGSQNLKKFDIQRRINELIEHKLKAERTSRDDLFSKAVRRLSASLDADVATIYQGLAAGTLTDDQKLAIKRVKPGPKGGMPEIELFEWVPQWQALGKVAGWDSPQKIELKQETTVKGDGVTPERRDAALRALGINPDDLGGLDD